MTMDPRKQRVLQAIVALYAMEGEPVGSGLLSNYLDLSVSSATDPIAKQLVDAADQLRGCDAFFSVILSPTDEKLYRTLGINICCEPKYEQRRYFHK